jgi:hypothetical protein
MLGVEKSDPCLAEAISRRVVCDVSVRLNTWPGPVSSQHIADWIPVFNKFDTGAADMGPMLAH